MDPRDLLYLALAEPIGLLLRTSDPARLRQRLYQARLKAADSALAALQFRLIAEGAIGEGNLIICKSGQLALASPSQTGQKPDA